VTKGPTSSAFVPPHVPAELVKHVDLVGDEEMRACPFSHTARLHKGPRIFWNTADPYFGGAWIPTRAQDIRFILGNPQLFRSKGQTRFAELAGQSWDIIPLEKDPPDHAKYRQMLNPLFSPSAVHELTPQLLARATALVDGILDRGECEFMAAFGRPFPVGAFVDLMGLPADQTDRFMKWEHSLLHDYDMAARGAAIVEVGAYLMDLAAERRARPAGDLTSLVISAKIDGRLLTDDEVLGTLFVLFMGGLDTVSSTLGLFFLHLAEHPDQQAELRANPAKIDHAVEELMRRYSVASVNRRCVKDTTLGGVFLKAGDWVSVTTSLASLDGEEFAAPLEVNLERKNIRHLGFSFGSHFCLGMHLARRELTIALREWLARIPPWRVKANTTPVLRGGGVYGVEWLALEWGSAVTADTTLYAR
jgi:cytochrome P450